MSFLCELCKCFALMEDRFLIRECQHALCRDSARGYFVERLKAEEETIKCPVQDCGATISRVMLPKPVKQLGKHMLQRGPHRQGSSRSFRCSIAFATRSEAALRTRSRVYVHESRARFPSLAFELREQ